MDGECDDYPYVTGSFSGDLALVGSIAAAVCVVCCFFLVFTYTPCGKKFIRGPEGTRTHELRTNRKSIVIEN